MYKKKEFYKFSIGARLYFGKRNEKIDKDIIYDNVKKILLETNSIKKYYYEDSELYIDAETQKKYNDCRIYVLDGEIYYIKADVQSTRNILEYKEVFKKYFKPLPAVNTVDNVNVDEFLEEYSFYRYTHNHTDVWMYFEENSSPYINYENKERIKEIQNWIRDNHEKYPNKPCILAMDNWCNSAYSVGWWIFRGWSEEYAKARITELQTENSMKFAEKRKENPEQYEASSTTNINYYLNKGYSLEESKKMLYERQNLTSLESFVRRYGEEEGTKRYNERIEKWQSSFKKPK